MWLSVTQTAAEREKKGGSREDEWREKGIRGTQWEEEEERKERKGLSWFSVTQRAAEGLTGGTNSLWCNANSISG